MNKNIIFIHVPKTGGTSINTMLTGSNWQSKPDFNYRHIDFESKQSNSADIFDNEKKHIFKAHNIFMMLRSPVDRLLSEYHFLKMRPAFFNLLSVRPKTFEEYCALPETQNYMIKFLLGYRIYDDYKVTKEDLSLVVSVINSLPIHVGIYEDYFLSLDYFSATCGVKWDEVVPVKRATLGRPSINTLSKSLVNSIAENNNLDLDLYRKQKEKLLDAKSEIIQKEYKLEGDRYDYVLRFVRRYSLIEITDIDKQFVELNQLFFKQLHREVAVKSNNGKDYVSHWNALFSVVCVEFYPELERVFLEGSSNNSLEKTVEMSAAINGLLVKHSNKNYKTLVLKIE